ncbi:MAG: cyclopropane-fatty-acyl-phospholipid synthase family protein [Phycisphaerales bacterium]|nr:cyclopropane-fatty-acyl-phospholipid synthase family protein [Phycisphaerales bacterium]
MATSIRKGGPQVITSLLMQLAERGVLPDGMIRAGIRRLCANRDASLQTECALETRTQFIEDMSSRTLAEVPHLANEQHYEVPAAFYEQCLGRHRKYSCCLWDEASDLDSAEARALEVSSDHADLQDGQRILELGCGWGSFTLWMARQFPNSTIVGISNSNSQRHSIERSAHEQGLTNIEIRTVDVNVLELDEQFDRIVSIEMMEHLRNWPKLLGMMRSWLKPDGLAFVHVFCHHATPYLFDGAGPGDWMSREFFSGGIMPSLDLLPSIDADMNVVEQWTWSGMEYAKTAEAWLQRLDSNRAAALQILADDPRGAKRALQRWRMFYLACAECFAMYGGSRWLVGHYRLKPVR